MAPDYPRALPSLIWYCQRVAMNHLDSIDNVDGLPYVVVEPILETCSAQHLSKLEQASPHIATDTAGLWRRLCENAYKQFWAEYENGKHEEPESWKDKFFDLQIQEEKRLEMLATKLRNQRVEHAERKKEREVKLTDRVPPSKRQRTWGQPAQKTLFDKARSRTAQLQQGIYARMLPPMPPAKNYSSVTKRRPTILTGSSGSSSLSSSSSRSSASDSGSRVTVKTVLVQKPQQPQVQVTSPSTAPGHTLAKRQTPLTVPPQVAPSPPSGKKDPMGALFMPKHRAYSQLPPSRSTAK